MSHFMYVGHVAVKTPDDHDRADAYFYIYNILPAPFRR